MDPDRVRAYLQAACAGLGFDIGEIWWTNIGDHHNGGTSTVAAIEEPPSDDDDDDHHSAASSSNEEVSVSGTASSTNRGHHHSSNKQQPKKKLRFVQLYTSKSFASRRSQLVRPEDSDDGAREHVLSPRLVHAIANTAQVVWAHANNSARSPGSGLTGRSDVTLHTAVGMPVAVDADGNMCVVVMFSPLVIENTAHAMDYLSSIARSATNSSIPCLLPVFDPQYSNMRPLLENNADSGSSGRRRSSLLTQHHTSVVPADALGEGVTARFVSFADTNEILGGGDDDYDNDETHDDHHNHHHSVTSAPKDTFGIPMLPGDDNDYDFGVDVFDEASYGIWNTIMDTLIEDSGVMNEDNNNGDDNNNNDPSAAGGSNQHDYNNGPGRSESQQRGAAEHSLTTPEAAWILQNSLPNPARLERLEEFFSAFLDMSVFDLADVWVPNTSDGTGIFLSHVLTTRCSSTNNASLEAFAAQNSGTTIAPWSGAVGRAYSSGNPVWSANRDIFVDETRDFGHDVIQTVLAVPVLTKHGTLLPRCVVACYSLVKSGSVPFVLRFVQQALQLLWDEKGLVENWNGVVAPADLGEMAADVEMQSHFMTKKRPHAALEDNSNKNNVSPDGDVDNDPVTADLSSLLQSVTLPNGDTITVPLQLDDDMMQAASAKAAAAAAVANHTTTPLLSVEQLQQHVYDAVRSVQNAVPFELQHASKRPHVEEQQHHHSATLGPIQNVTPLSMPAPLPTHIVQGGGGGGGGGGAQQQQQRRASQKAAAVPANMTFHQSGSPQSPQQQPMQQQQQQSVPQQTTFPWMSQQSPGSPQSVPASNQPRPQQQQQQQQQAFPLPVFSIGDQCFFIPNGDGDSMPIPDMATSGAFGQHSACRIQGCAELAHPRRPYCQKHAGNRLCEHVGCDKCAQGSTRFCIAHGGGRRCTFPGCDKGARDKFFCAAHGGGKRCRASGCTKSAVGGSTYCTAHGGGRRCAVDGCDKSAQSSTNFCVKHGGGKKCAHEGCEKVARGRTQFCAAHGGGVRCKLEGCNRVAIGKFQLCRTHGGGSGGGDGRGHVRNTSLSPASIEASNVSNNPFAGSPSTVSDNSAMAAMGMQQHVL